MTVVRISHLRRQETHADRNIVPRLKPLWTDDCRIGVAVDERLALRFSAGTDFPTQLRFDAGKGIGQCSDMGWLPAQMLQRRRQMVADRQARRGGAFGLAG